VVSVAFHIWIRALTLNALILGLYSFSETGIYFILTMLGVFIGSLVCTLPILFIIVIWLKCFYVLPYNIIDKLRWLAFVLMASAMAFYMLLSLLLHVPLFGGDPFIVWLLLISLFSVAVAIFWARKLIINFKNS
jgi:hypothetical protein